MIPSVFPPCMGQNRTGHLETWSAGRKMRGPLQEQQLPDLHFSRDYRTQLVQLTCRENGTPHISFAGSSSFPWLYHHDITKMHHMVIINLTRHWSLKPNCNGTKKKKANTSTRSQLNTTPHSFLCKCSLLLVHFHLTAFLWYWFYPSSSTMWSMNFYFVPTSWNLQ